MLRIAGHRHRFEGLSTWIYTTHRHRSSTAGDTSLKRKHSEPPASQYTSRPNMNTPRSFSERRNAPLDLDDLVPFGKSKPLRSAEPRPPNDAYPPPKHSSRPSSDPTTARKPFTMAKSTAPVIKEADVLPYFESQVSQWASHPATADRFITFGLPPGDTSKLLDKFAMMVKSGSLSDTEGQTYYQLSRFAQPHDSRSIDMIYSTIFFWWCERPANQNMLQEAVGVSPDTLYTIKQLVEATERVYPQDDYPSARELHRKIIMHVGPTNSGKTHHALRALAAAPSGVYAGPLRLLAHEIWERLNTGQIIPLGAEEDATLEPDSISTEPTPASSRKGNPKYARQCNMITGEEQKFVGEDVPHLSCTIEMLSYRSKFSVAVIDEIQMICDPDRGSGWMNAVLGTNAQEVHLCGEETAVPVVQELLKHTGDEVIVRRYERLTPLVVEEESLGSDLTKIRKGDCIVTFSRTNIFKVKRLVEAKTGMRCAVVYGRLPPEVRSEQAALFNDPDSGYDVLIGSDAIGMGLNLKIKRVVFEAVAKYEGAGQMQPLSISSIKQIAGRAGRFGLHGSDDTGGSVTTLHEADLPYLKECVAQPYKPLPFARIGHNREIVANLSSILPPDASLETLIEAPMYIGRLPDIVRYSDRGHIDIGCTYLDNQWRDMSIETRLLLLYAPVPWRDYETTTVIKRLLSMHKLNMSVNLKLAIMGTGYIPTMALIEQLMQSNSDSSKAYIPNTASTLILLEAFHKVVVFYVWMSFRNPVVYADYDDAVELKGRLEKVLTWCLESISRKLGVNSADGKTTSDSNESADKLTFKTKTQIRKEVFDRRRLTDLAEPEVL